MYQTIETPIYDPINRRGNGQVDVIINETDIRANILSRRFHLYYWHVEYHHFVANDKQNLITRQPD